MKFQTTILLSGKTATGIVVPTEVCAGRRPAILRRGRL